MLGSLAGGAALIAAFAAWQRRAAYPMLPPQPVRAPAPSRPATLAIFLTFATLFTGVFFFAQLLQVVLGYDALDAGLRLMPVDGDLPDRRPARRRAGRPDRRALAADRRADC